ncbi:MAG: trypsin-like peptidase domain-containing protein [Pirellulaceae bacterium]|nr:trypsin-like peptidase domain-containing protein [Pirellulaceae bacterium]
MTRVFNLARFLILLCASIQLVGSMQIACVAQDQGLKGRTDAVAKDTSGSDVPIERKTANAKDLSDAFRAAAAKGLPAVVTVFARRTAADNDDKYGLLELLGEDPSDNHNIGSGVIISPDGLIVTNHHVVEKSARVRVRLPDGREFLASDIKSDESSDLAILSIPTPKKLTSIAMGNSDTMAVGDWVLAVGSPFAIEQTVSAGIISGKARGLKGLLAGQLLQTDAAINPGNSGGALVNLDGELVGINTAIASTSGVFEGVGFAIPINRVKWIVSELRTNGKVRRAMMGAEVAKLPPEIAEQLDLPIQGGALVVRIRDGYPAEKAGLKKGDVVIRIADQAVQSQIDLNAIVEQLPVGQPQSIIVLREGERVEMSISLQAKRE